MSAITFSRVSPGSTVQDEGRPGKRVYGAAAGGPMDRGAFLEGGRLLTEKAGSAALELGMLGADFTYAGAGAQMAVSGGDFKILINGQQRGWPGLHQLEDGDRVEITTGQSGLYGYARFDREIDIEPVMGSRSANLMAGLGGGALTAGDRIGFLQASNSPPGDTSGSPWLEGPIRVLPGLHASLLGSRWADLFDADFEITSRFDRMGIRLNDRNGFFAEFDAGSLVSDFVVPGDVQILGDGTPVILMRDHQPTGGYPRVATVISAELDRLAQMRPGTRLQFQPATLAEAQRLARGGAA
ncbi:5-oxoprolinase subunit C family protein [Cucumibacter marinus]|uniref:5-oxoprolinase subunit C family protein n=1 Tax=Cucumibacter marinus TaxID=1121252 RepID=UPI0006862437|nr:biotin-dependent carboxyltransferase family protein [Cucumibacter marinus]